MNISNNAPDVVLELTNEQAEFLLRNCSTNVAFGLGSLQTLAKDPDVRDTTVQKLVEQIDTFSALRDLLRKQGVAEE